MSGAGQKPPEAPEEWRALLLSFVASLSLCDHMGDVADDVEAVLRQIRYPVPEGDGSAPYLDDVRQGLAKAGVRTLYGTELRDDEDDG